MNNWNGKLIWECKIGRLEYGTLPSGSDLPMRYAVQAAFKLITGLDAEFTFSGWNADLTESEMKVITEK